MDTRDANVPITKLSVLLYIRDFEWTKLALNKITAKNKKSVHNLQVFLLDSSGDEEILQLCEQTVEAYPDVFIYIPAVGRLPQSCYNEILEQGRISGDFVCFTDDEFFFGNDSLEVLLNGIEAEPECRIFAMRPYYFDQNELKVNNIYYGASNKYVDIDKNLGKINAVLQSYFFKTEDIRDLRFAENITLEYDIAYLLDALEKYDQYFLLKTKVYCNEALDKDFYNYPKQFLSDFYIPSMDNFILPTLREKGDRWFVQFMMYYLISLKYLYNLNHRDKAVLLFDEVDVFFAKVKEALQYIDDSILVQYSVDTKRLLPRYMEMYFWSLKHDRGIEDLCYEENGEVFLPSDTSEDRVQLAAFVDIIAEFLAINFDGQKLIFDIKFVNVYFLDFERIRTYIRYGSGQSQTIEGNRNKIYSKQKYFNRSLKKDYTCQIEIPEEVLNNIGSFQLHLSYDGQDVVPITKFVKCQTHLWQKLKVSGWCFENKILYWKKKQNKFIVKKNSFVRMKYKEFCYQKEFSKEKKQGKAAAEEALELRKAYWKTKEKYQNKTIWITFDQIFKGGDNAEYFYRYVSENKKSDNLEIYYVMREDAPGYEELNAKYHTVLAWDSFELKLMALHADVIFATRVGANEYVGLDKALQWYVRDLFNAEVICLQHGLSIQKIAEYQNRLIDNTKLYMCVSPYEVSNLSHPIYGYKPEDLVLTGAPRYDGLISNDQRFILISPTWRRNVVAGTNTKGSEHNYSSNFKITKYYQIYNSLINNEKLIEKAKEKHYRIIYLIHPILSPQIDDFERNDYVEIQSGIGVNYEKILTEASLMVTDYSGIQFDFAYMRKPLVYYHPDELPPQYEEGGLVYDTTGFGPVCANEQSLVDTLCQYMEQDCRLDETYRGRIDSFFAFDDHNNSARVYEAAVQRFPLKKN